MLGRCRLAQAAVESLSPVLSWYWWPCRGSVSGTGGLAESLCLWYWWPCQSFPADAGGHPDPGGGWRRRLDYSDALALRCYNQNTLHWPCVVTTRTRCTSLALLQPEHVALALRCYNQNTLHWPCVFPPKTRCTGLALLQPKHVALALRCYNQNTSALKESRRGDASCHGKWRECANIPFIYRFRIYIYYQIVCNRSTLFCFELDHFRAQPG